MSNGHLVHHRGHEDDDAEGTHWATVTKAQEPYQEEIGSVIST